MASCSSIQFGYFLTPQTGDYRQLLEKARLAERLGLDLIGVQDHPYQPRFFDTWTLISALAAQTERLRFFPDVANLPLRPPAMLAKAAASLDQITSGRIDLGLGAGYFWDGIAALGGPRRQPGDAVDAVEEAIHVCRLMWSGERSVAFEGKHYELGGAKPGPEPAHPIEIWLGAIHNRMLALTGMLCDGWIPSSPYVPPDQLNEKNRRIDEAAADAGRDPGKIRRLYNVMGLITDGETGDYLKGPVDRWVEELVRLAAEDGMDTFLFAPSEATDDQLRLFAEEVVPEVRSQLETR